MPFRSARCVPCLVIAAVALLAAPPVRAQRPRAPELVASTDPRPPEEERQGFRLPPGFEIELVASEPDIQKPMNLAFDARGRLWVTSSVEYPYPVEPGTPGRDRVTILDDFGPDGRARSITVFADDLNIPIGVLPLRDGALVHSIPNIYRMRDTDGDGKADERQVWYGTYGFRDTHGMTSAFSWGFDGWIYACHGFANDSTVRGSDGRELRMNSGNTYRLKADGTTVEHYTSGQVNPFGLSFDPLGNLFSADCHSRPIMMLLREGSYSSFGKPHDGLGFAPEIMSHDHGSTGIAGIVAYAAQQFPPAYRDAIFIGNVVTSRINCDRLEWNGSSPRAAAQPDFVVSDDPWFRPVDLELGPDGCLYVADFYNKIIGHYEVPLDHPGRDRHRGRIWRIRYAGAEPHDEPTAPRSDWTSAAVAELIDDLGHPNLAVRLQAANELVERRDHRVRAAVLEALADSANPWRPVHALWVAHRIEAVDDGVLHRAATDRRQPLLRTHAMRVLAERPALSSTQHALAVAGLADPDPFVRRAAAEALGRHPDPENLRPLLQARDQAPDDDPQLVHMIRIALRNQLRGTTAWDQIAAVPWSQRDLEALADVALGVRQVEAATFLVRMIRAGIVPDADLARVAHHIARQGNSAHDAELLELLDRRRGDGLTAHAARLKALAQGVRERGSELSTAVRGRVLQVARAALATADALAAGVDLAATLRLDEVRATLTALALKPVLSPSLRGAALAALLAIDPADAIEPIAAVLEDGTAPPALREQAANLLGQVRQASARARLAASLPTTPARLQTVLAENLAATPDGARQLLAAVAEGRASPQLLQSRVVATRLRQARIEKLEERLAALTAALEPIDSEAQALIARRRAAFATAKTDLRSGADLFAKHCAACHQLGGEGAKIGPQLDGVGVRGLERLLEDVLDPNRNVDQAFRTTTLALGDGRVLTGLVLREEGETIVLADNQGKEVSVPKAAVEEKQTIALSLMPARFADLVTEQELHDLMAFLLTQREMPAER